MYAVQLPSGLKRRTLLGRMIIIFGVSGANHFDVWGKSTLDARGLAGTAENSPAKPAASPRHPAPGTLQCTHAHLGGLLHSHARPHSRAAGGALSLRSAARRRCGSVGRGCALYGRYRGISGGAELRLDIAKANCRGLLEGAFQGGGRGGSQGPLHQHVSRRGVRGYSRGSRGGGSCGGSSLVAGARLGCSSGHCVGPCGTADGCSGAGCGSGHKSHADQGQPKLLRLIRHCRCSRRVHRCHSRRPPYAAGVAHRRRHRAAGAASGSQMARHTSGSRGEPGEGRKPAKKAGPLDILPSQPLRLFLHPPAMLLGADGGRMGAVAGGLHSGSADGKV